MATACDATTARQPTRRQAEFLRLVYRLAVELGRYPMFREITAVRGWRSPNAVNEHVKRLARLGLLVKPEARKGASAPYTLAGLRMVPTLAADEAGERLAEILRGGGE